MRTSRIIAFLACAIAIASCSKNDATGPFGTPPPPNTPNFSKAIQLNPGSYWVYDDGDSIWISGDTSINGVTYHIRQRKFAHSTEYLRDSAGYVLNQNGDKVFSATDFKDTLWKHAAFFGKMASPDTVITVPAGTFKAVAYVTNYYRFIGMPIEMEYANGVGIIREVRSGEAIRFDEKLVKYKLK